ERSRRRRTPRDLDVDGDHAGDTAETRVAVAEDPARAATVADGDDELRLRGGVVSALKCDRHVLGYRAGDEQHVGVARARDEADAESLDVVVRIAERVDLELAAVARAGVDLADRQRAAERSQNLFLQPGDHDSVEIGVRRGVGLDAGLRDLAE